MPIFRLETNVPKERIPKEFNKELTSILSKCVGKPESKFAVTVIPNVMLTYGGTDVPCATASLVSIGKIGPTENLKYSKILHDKISQDLGIPMDRILIEFRDVKAHDIGSDGLTAEVKLHA